MDIKNIQKILRKYHQLCSNRLGNLKEMDRFLNKFNLPKLIHNDIGNLNTSITKIKTESVIKTLPTRKLLGLGFLTTEFNGTLKELIAIFLKLFKTIEREGISSTFSMSPTSP